MLNIEFASSLGQGLWQFVSYMGLAIFAENVILARALGVTRLMKLVPDHKAQVWDLCLPLIWVMALSAPLGWAAHNLLFPWLRSRLPAWLPIWAAAWATPSSSSSCVKAAAACAVRRCLRSFRACPVP